MKPQSALLLATGAALTGTVLLARRRLPPLPEPQLGPTLLVVAEERSSLERFMPAASAIDAALRPVNLAGGTWIGLGPRITRATHRPGPHVANSTYVTTVAQPVTWPVSTAPGDLDSRVAQVVTTVTAALRRSQGGFAHVGNPDWTFVGAVPFDPGAYGAPSFWVYGDARTTRTRDAVVKNLREDPVGPRGSAAERSLSQTCCGWAAGAAMVYVAYRVTKGVAYLTLPPEVTTLRHVVERVRSGAQADAARRRAETERHRPQRPTEHTFKDGAQNLFLLVRPQADGVPVLERITNEEGASVSWQRLSERGRVRLDVAYRISPHVLAS